MRFLKGLVLTTENRGPTALWDGKVRILTQNEPNCGEFWPIFD